MAAPEAAIQRQASASQKTLDGRVKPGHDDTFGSKTKGGFRVSRARFFEFQKFQGLSKN
jgi:hypothetical protein